MIIRKGEIINFNGLRYECLVKEIAISKIMTKQGLDELCYIGILRNLTLK